MDFYGFERDFGLASEQWQLWSWVQDQWISLVQTQRVGSPHGQYIHTAYI